jgi:hypothetical protein
VYISLNYFLGLGRLGFHLPTSLVAPGFCRLVVVSGYGVALLGGYLEVNFCFLHGESMCGAGLVVIVGSRYVSFVCSLFGDWGGDAFDSPSWDEVLDRGRCRRWWILLRGRHLSARGCSSLCVSSPLSSDDEVADARSSF